MALGMEVDLGIGHIVLDGDPAPLPKNGAEPLSQFSAHFYCGQTAVWIKMPLGTAIGLDRDDIVLDGDPAPPPRKGTAPNFRPMSIVVKRIPLSTEVGLSLGDMVLDGYSASPPLKGHSPQYSANVCCGQTAGWTKMPLGMEVGLSPGDFVFDGDPARPRKKRTPTPPNVWPMFIVAKRLDESRCHLVLR